ncbi:MAG: FHA domain-containing protein, partial [Gammaproteobacteria bacterium]|nr:FHA domain-containing protein [Gammaproteobacteria bacterium]
MAILILLDDGVASTKFPLDKDTLGVGRGMDNEITIDDIAVSSRHCRIFRETVDSERGIYAYAIEDLDSTNGTFINDQQIKRQQLRNNDLIRIAFHEFRFIDEN